jgi:hypothetical protein
MVWVGVIVFLSAIVGALLYDGEPHDGSGSDSGD